MKNLLRTTLLLLSALVAIAAAVVPILPQAPAAKKPAFDVTSVKPSTSAGNGMRGMGAPGGNFFNATNASVRMLLQYAFRLPNNQPLQIIGGPAWMDSDLFDIQARPEGDSRQIPPAEMQLMVQSLLEDRFQLKAHRETRELPVYDLSIAKGGLKMKLSEDQTPITPGVPGGPGGPPPPGSAPPLPPGAGARGEAPGGGRGAPPDFIRSGSRPRGAVTMMMDPSGPTLRATAAPIATLVNLLQGQAGRPIIDKTDLKGLFDFELHFAPGGGQSFPGGGQSFGLGPGGPAPAGPAIAPPPAAADPAPSLFTAVQEQLGLKLESTKGPVEVLVIDSVQKPSKN